MLTEREFAAGLTSQLNEALAGDEELGTVVQDGVHIYIKLGPHFGEDAGVQFTLLVIREER